MEEAVGQTHATTSVQDLAHATNDDNVSVAGSEQGLREHAVPPAIGNLSRFSEADMSPALAEVIDKDAAPAEPPTAQPAKPKPPLWKRRWFIITVVLSCLGIALLFIFLYPVVRAIAQHIINVSVLNIDKASIISPQNGSFTLALDGWVSHAGIFNSKLDFLNPIDVSWQEPGVKNAVPLASFRLGQLLIRNKRAYMNQTVSLNITDQSAFGRFTKLMITSQNFTWILASSNLRVAALKFPVAHGLSFNKHVTLNGMNNFNGEVVLNDLLLPGDTTGGLNFTAATQLTNKSPFQLQLGTVVFDLTYQDVYLGTGSAPNVQLLTGANNITLTGVLVNQSGTTNLTLLSQLFTEYLNHQAPIVKAIGKSVILASDGTTISWLSDGLQSLVMQVPFQSQSAINPIQSIDIADLSLAFDSSSPWAPLANSQHVAAGLKLPFGFQVSIGEIQNSFNITSMDGKVAAGLSTPLGSSTSNISVFGTTDTHGTINITIANTRFSIMPEDYTTFSQFTTNITQQVQPEFLLVGRSHAVANLSIGQLVLDPILFNVTSGLRGLRGLQGDVTIDGVDVVGGTAGGLTLAINVTINNPSSLNLSVGDLSLNMYRNNTMIGTALMPNLTLNMGQNIVHASAVFNSNGSPEGLDTLNKFVASQDVALTIAGFKQSTNIPSLSQAFSTLNVNTTLPGLKSGLLSSASLVVLNTTGHGNNLTDVSVALANPFSSTLSVSQISSTVSYLGIPLGTISSSTNWTAAANVVTTSPQLSMNMNMDPPSLFTVLRALAVTAGLSTTQLDGIVALGGYSYKQITNGPSPSKREIIPRANQYTGFDFVTYVNTAFQKLKADVVLQSNIKIGDYQTTLQYTQASVPVKTDSTINYLLPILAGPIVQKIVNGATLGINNLTISNPTQTFFDVLFHGSLTSAGPFDATISFPSGLDVAWSGQKLGSIVMPDVKVTGDTGASLSFNAKFHISDVNALTSFTEVLISQPSFVWDISGQNLTVSALGISVTQVALNTRSIPLLGMNNLQNGVVINSFNLPSDDPAGGITLQVNSSITNPSHIGITLPTLGFQAYSNQVNLGPLVATDVAIPPRNTVLVPLTGRLISQNTAQGLAEVSTIFSNYIAGIHNSVSVQGDTTGNVNATWLTTAIQRLSVGTVLPSPPQSSVITAATISDLQMGINPSTQYAPVSSSAGVQTNYNSPFIDITFVPVTAGTSVALGPGTIASNAILGRTNTQNTGQFASLFIKSTQVQAIPVRPGTGSFLLPWQAVPLTASPNNHPGFSSFFNNVVNSTNVGLDLAGYANTTAHTAIGLLSLTNIAYNVNSNLAGMQGFRNATPIASNLDLSSGQSDSLTINVQTSLQNPSNITINIQDTVTFGLRYLNYQIGNAYIYNMTLSPGHNSIPVVINYAPPSSALHAGQQLLGNYLQGVNSVAVISQGFTNIQSLQSAFSGISISPNIPPTNSNIIPTVSLTLPVDIVQTKRASVTFTLANQFTASISLVHVVANAYYNTLYLGGLDVTLSPPVTAGGHQNITVGPLTFNFNLDPITIVNLILSLATANNVNLGPLPALFNIVLQNPNYQTNITTSVDLNPPTCVSGNQFDVNTAIITALRYLEITMAIQTNVMIGSYNTDLSFNQSKVPAATGNSALYLIGAVGAPIVQTLVSQATLAFTQANITNITDNGFDIALQGSLTGTGPLDAFIAFVAPVIVTWQGQDIATIALPPVCAAANTGVPNYNTNGHLVITNRNAFTQFATYLLHNPSFDWTISTNRLRVTALGTIFDNVILSKTVTLKAFNGLPGVTISNFKLPSDDPAGGIHIDTDSSIPSPAQLGMALGTVGFQVYFNNVSVGPLSGSNLFLAPGTSTPLHLSGRITPKSGNDLNIIGTLFSNYLQGQTQTLSVTGDYVQPVGDSAPVQWLTTAFKTLTLQVPLPGQKFQVIQSITLYDFGIKMTTSSEDYAPLASSNDTLAVYRNPFGFSLQVIQAAEHITLSNSNGGFATLDIPSAKVNGGVSTGNDANLLLQFQDQPLKSTNNAGFQQLFQQVTDTKSATFNLGGTTDITAHTSIGDVPIAGIAFSVSTTLTGMNDFGGTATLGTVSITGSGGNGGNEYVKSSLTTTLQNPSNVSLETINIALPVYYKNSYIGRAAINPFNLMPGQNVLATEFHYEPSNANDSTAQDFLSNLLQTSNDLPLTIRGDAASTPFQSLQPALEGVSLSTSVKGLNINPILTHVNVKISVPTLLDNYVVINFDIHNSLGTDLKVLMVQADGKVDGETYAHFDQMFENFLVPAHGSANSGEVEHVLLTKGALASLKIIPRKELDVYIAATIQVGGSGGYTIPWLQLTQLHTPTDYDVALWD